MSTPVLWMIFFALPGASAALWQAVPWLSVLLLLSGLVCLVARLWLWVTDDTWRVRRDAARQAARTAERAAALRFPTSRRALGQHLP